jgi:predicted Zn-dependent protease
MSEERREAGSRWHVAIGAVLVASALVMVASAQTTKPELYFVAIGDVPVDMFNGLVSHFETRFAVPIKTLSPLGFDQQTFDSQRSQAVADRLIQAVRFRHPSLVKNPRTRVIGITSLDMFMEAMREQWAFTFSMRSADRRLAVVSYARMDPGKLGGAPNDALLQSRLRKMLTKNIGIMYFGLPASENPRSALFRNILGVDDLDRMSEDFNPK